MVVLEFVRRRRERILLYSWDDTYLSGYTTTCAYRDNSKILFVFKSSKKRQEKKSKHMHIY